MRALLILALLVACTSQPAKPPATTLEQVQRTVPKDQVGAAYGVTVPGVDVFEVSDPEQSIPADGNRSFHIVAIAGGVGKPILETRHAIIQAVFAATKDPALLARVGLLLNGRDETPLVKPEDDAQRAAKITAPALVGTTVELWTFAGAPSRSLSFYKLDLTTGLLERASRPGAE